jgi:hypothetical protein
MSKNNTNGSFLQAVELNSSKKKKANVKAIPVTGLGGQ